MTPDNQAQRENPFPQEYQHLDQWVGEAEARLRQLDAELNRRDPGRRLTFDPPGYGPAPQPPRRSTEEIQREKDDLKANVYQRR